MNFVLGIDVGCSATRRSSAACRLAWDERVVHFSVERFRAAEPERANAIIAVGGKEPLAAVAIDGPLAPEFGTLARYRACERLLTRGLTGMIGKPGQSSTPVGQLLNHLASACARIVRDRLAVAPATHDEPIDAVAIVEAFPSSFLGALLTPPRIAVSRATRSDLYFAEAVTNGAVGGLLSAMLGRSAAIDPAMVTNHDERAAFICALTALCVAMGRYTAVGDAVDGWIILPPRAFIAPDVLAALMRNEMLEERRSVVFHD